jgi:hypothetical protein
VAGNLISAFVLFRIANALLESFPGLECIEGPCKSFSGSSSDEFTPASAAAFNTSASAAAAAASVVTRQSRWGPDIGWFFNIVALGIFPPQSASSTSRHTATRHTHCTSPTHAQHLLQSPPSVPYLQAAPTGKPQTPFIDNPKPLSFTLDAKPCGAGLGHASNACFAAKGRRVRWSIFDHACNAAFPQCFIMCFVMSVIVKTLL